MSTDFDPIELGEHAQHNYANYLIGNNQRGYQGLLQNFAHGSEESAEQAFIRSKGPYLQGVASAAWSDTPWPEFANSVEGEFAPNGLEQPLIDAFEAEGFESLQVHQEQAINWLCDDNHALIAAGTGRGKTEAWFIPLLQYILRAKRNQVDGVDPNSIKALLTYPTKALAQDQLKRFIEYLWIVNRRSSLAEDEHITIGVYDGDTPRRGQRKDGKSTHKYLEDSFEYFELPELIADELAESDAIRENEAPNLHVKKDGQEYYLKTRGGYGGEFLRFVHLTRDRIEDEQPDILLTNPDAINYRLFNINDRQAHRLFVDQPKFLVFDEVHTYKGLFGAHASMLVKRLRKLREARGIEDPLRLIAASATIGQKEELFQRLLGIRRGDPYRVIEEKVGLDDEDDEGAARAGPGVLPGFLQTMDLDAETVEADLERWRGGKEPQTHGWLTDLDVDPTYGRGPGAVLERATETGDLECLLHLHQVLQDPDHDDYELPEAPRLADLVEYIQATYRSVSDEETAHRVAKNALTLFEIAGFEVRVHVFNWPVDGYYKCLHCHRIYAKPQSCDCGEEDRHTRYVTKIRLCNKCGEQVYEGWYCPDCGDVRPVTQETEGEYLYAEEPECAHENHGALTRIYWTPEYECGECGREAHPSEALGDCRQCGGRLTRTPEGIICKNPDCGATVERTVSDCNHCGGELDIEGDVSYECTDPECAEHGKAQDGPACDECESRLVPKMVLPWICSNPDHGMEHDTTDPDQPACGTSTFVLPAYIDVTEADYCNECNADRSDVYYLAGTGCAIHDDDVVDRVQKSFNLRVAYRDSDGNVRLDTPSTGKHAVPCYHKYRDYDTLMRSPINTGVTMSQFMLRELADEGTAGQRRAKLMSFADSYRDMERLANDFDEPERLLFIQQVLLSYMADERRATLEEVIEGTMQRARDYWDGFETKEDIIDDVIGYIEWRHTVTGQVIAGSYRLFNGDYGREYGRLVGEGLLNIGLKRRPASDDERAACRELLDGNRQDEEQLMGKLQDSEGVDSPTEVLNTLEERGLIRIEESSGRISFDPAAVEVRYVDDRQPIRYLHEVDQFVSDVQDAVTTDKTYDHAKNFTSSYEDRASLSSPHFTRTAYWAAGTDTRMLLSHVYKGDLQAAERRGIEHEFKRNSTPNFLSTGPAMEIGIDIGDLNTLLLLGTPPNTNAYLQRIGRAGRSSGKSLVTTISKRNPIDFYYHKRPDELIESKEKPIPLNPHNEHVLRSALTWGVMDYIAANYAIPWKKADQIEGTEITAPDPSEWNRYKKDEPREQAPSEFEHFTSVYYRNVDAVTDGKCLAVLGAIAERDDGVRAWLEELLDYAYCRQCGHMYDADVRGTCDNCDSTSELLVARQEFHEVINKTLKQFKQRLVTFAREYKQEVKQEINRLDERKEELRQVVQDNDDGWGWDEDEDEDDDEVAAEQELDRVRSQLRTLEDLLNEYKDADLAEIHQRSAQSAYVPQMRAFGDSVSVTRHVRDKQSGETRATQDPNWDRDEAMALRELHPYAYNLKSKRGYVATRIHEDTESTRELKNRLGGKQLVCEDCGYEGKYAAEQNCPECGEIDGVRTIEPIALKRVELSDKAQQFDAARANEVYPLVDYHTNPQNTYAPVETTVENFEATRQLELEGPTGETFVTLEHGDIKIIETVSAYTTSYSSGARDPGMQPLTICRESHCNSVVVQQNDEDQVCLRDPQHDQSAQQDVMIGRTFETKGIRLKSAGPEVSSEALHTLLHGFRLGLQRIGGVEIRQLNESYQHGDQEGHIFEGTIGGNGVTNLLFDRVGDELRELNDALSVMSENIGECDCAAGCPECVYQYGCDERNDERTFDKDRMLRIAEQLTGAPDDVRIVADD